MPARHAIQHAHTHVPAGRALCLEGAKGRRHDRVARVGHGLFLRVVVLPLHAPCMFLRLTTHIHHRAAQPKPPTMHAMPR